MDSVDGASRSHLVGWTLPPLGYSQILTTAETQHIPLPSTCEETGTFAGSVHVSHAAYSSRKRRNRETRKRQAKSLKPADREAKRKLLAQREISHVLAEQLPRSREPRTNEHLAFDSRKPSACTFARPLKRVSSATSVVSRRKARRKLGRGLMPDAQVLADARRAL